MTYLTSFTTLVVLEHKINSKFITTEKNLLFLWFVAMLAIGALTVHEYGVSIDEPDNYRYATDTLNAYPSFFGTLYEPRYYSAYDGHGPAFVTIASILINIVQFVFPTVFAPDLWHFSYFIAFQITCLCLYKLARRWFNNWSAWGILILFSTQPLFFGHAFINPKDIPFMALFIASIVTGFAMVDRTASQASYPEIKMENIVSADNFGRTLWRQFRYQVAKCFTEPMVLWAGIILGLTTSIRILGPYAGAIVALYALYKSIRRTPGLFLAYFTTAALVCYLTWPILWSDPLAGILHAFRVASEYPWQGSVLFDGKVIAATDLPARYLPWMMFIQFTEAAIILFVVGAVLATWKAFKEKIMEPIALLLIWFLAPLAAIILSRSVVYDGFRHIFFLLPPLFICTGFAFDWIFKKLKAVALRLVVLALVMVPAIFSIVRLHPYEYIYYNGFVGGTQGAYEKYELDYWATSYREIALFVNETAPPNTNMVIFGSVGTYLPYSRPDIRLYDRSDIKALQGRDDVNLDYAVIFNRRKVIQENCINAETIKSVERAGVVLAVLKKIPSGQDDCP